MIWANKNCKHFNIYNIVFIYFFFKKRKTPGDIIFLHLCTKNVDITYNSWIMEHDRLDLVILSHFLTFFHPKNLENQNFEKIKKARDTILHVHQKSWSYDVQFLRYRVKWKEFFAILGHLCPLPLPLRYKMCTKNHYHIMYPSQDCNRRKFWSL